MMTQPASPRSTARHLIAGACGVSRDVETRCACCSVSPFGTAGPLARTLGAGFSDWQTFQDPRADTICRGCARLLAGRPGDDPPPLRTRTIMVVDGQLQIVPWPDMWGLITMPPRGVQVVSWAVSNQKHHVLYAELCNATELRVGSDTSTIAVWPERDQPLARAVRALRRANAKGKPYFTRDEIASGAYRVPAIAAYGAAAWAQHESVVAARRGDPVMALYLAHAPVTPMETERHSDMDDTDQQAVDLLAALAKSSALRISDGLGFWGSLFVRRVRRHAARALPDFLSRLMADLQIDTQSVGAQQAATLTRAITDTDAAALMQIIRERPELLIALAFDYLKTMKKEQR